jgi:hypothetical protein
MGDYTVSFNQWKYSDDPTTTEKGKTSTAIVVPDTLGGTAPPAPAAKASISANASAAGPYKTSSAEAATSATQDITFTWTAAPGTNEAAVSKEYNVTVGGTRSYSVAANVDGTATAKAGLKIGTGSTTIYDVSQPATSSSSIKAEKFSTTSKYTIDKNTTLTIEISVASSATRTGEGAKASSSASVEDVVVEVA